MTELTVVTKLSRDATYLIAWRFSDGAFIFEGKFQGKYSDEFWFVDHEEDSELWVKESGIISIWSA